MINLLYQAIEHFFFSKFKRPICEKEIKHDVID